MATNRLQDLARRPVRRGVFCKPNVISLGTGTDLTGFNVHDTIGVQGQVFTIVNSDDPEYHKINRRVAGQRASKVLLLPLGAQPLPRLLELAASNAADSQPMPPPLAIQAGRDALG